MKHSVFTYIQGDSVSHVDMIENQKLNKKLIRSRASVSSQQQRHHIQMKYFIIICPMFDKPIVKTLLIVNDKRKIYGLTLKIKFILVAFEWGS